MAQVKIEYTPQATADVESILAYINERNPAGAAKVSEAIRSTVRTIEWSPNCGTNTDTPNIQRYPLTKYPYAIFYTFLEAQNTIRLITIRHTSRNPIF